MLKSSATTVGDYLSSLPADRRDAIARVRDVINATIPAGFSEGMQYGMISWFVPRERLVKTYNGQPLALACLGSQKQYMVLHLMNVYGDPRLEAALRAGFAAAGKKLDMGKACVRFKTTDALALDVIGDTMSRLTVDDYVAAYERVHAKKTNAPSRTKSAVKAKANAKPARTPKARATGKSSPKARATVKSSPKARATVKSPSKARRTR